MKSRSPSSSYNESIGDAIFSKDSSDTSSMTSEFSSLAENESTDLRCGYARYKPVCLQRCNNSKCLLAVISWFVFVQSFVVSGIVNVNTATLERRFDLSSSQVAWISSSYDLCGGVLSFIIGYLATFANKPRMMTISAAIMTVGSFVMFLPHLIVEPYTLGTKVMETCDASGNSTDQCSTRGSESGLSRFVYVLIAGQLLHAVGGVTAYTVGTPVVDESTDCRHSPVYIGIMHGTSALGPAVGFLFGGVMLHYYVDFDRIDMSTIDVTPDDPRWVGAWWVGFAVAAGAGISVVMLLACFARELPDTDRYRITRKSETYAGHGEKETEAADFGRSWRDFVTSLRIVFCNPTWMFMTVASILEAGIIQAFVTFMPKVLQFQFAMTPGKAAILAGSLVVPGAAIGQVLGGFIPKWLNLRVRGLTLQCAICCALTLTLAFTFVFRCEMPNIAGVTTQYVNTTESINTAVDLDDACNADCGCSLQSYEPVCSVDGIQYFSSCHAGCRSIYQPEGGDTIYYNCACINSSQDETVAVMPADWNSTRVLPQAAVEGICSQDCDAVKWFLPFVFLMTMGTFIGNTAFFSVTMRVVPVKQRAFACGVQGTLVRFFGATPFPLLFGLLFDQVCLVWQETCSDDEGSCWIYDNQVLGQHIMYMIISVKAISTVAFFTAVLVYKPPRHGDVDSDDVLDSITISSKEHADSDDPTMDTMLDADPDVNSTKSRDVVRNNIEPSLVGQSLDSRNEEDRKWEISVKTSSDSVSVSNGCGPVKRSDSGEDTSSLTSERLTIHSSNRDNESQCY